MIESEEEPIVTLKGNVRLFYVGLILIPLILVVSLMFVVPVIITGDISSGIPYNSNRHIYSVIHFMISIIFIFLFPFTITILNLSNTYKFYNQYLVIEKRYGKNKIIPYKKMHIKFYSTYFVLTDQAIPRFSRPIIHYKIKYLNGIIIDKNKYHIVNRSDLEHAIHLLQNRAAFVTYK